MSFGPAGMATSFAFARIPNRVTCVRTVNGNLRLRTRTALRLTRLASVAPSDDTGVVLVRSTAFPKTVIAIGGAID
jgi:hypothetical protein